MVVVLSTKTMGYYEAVSHTVYGRERDGLDHKALV